MGESDNRDMISASPLIYSSSILSLFLLRLRPKLRICCYLGRTYWRIRNAVKTDGGIDFMHLAVSVVVYQSCWFRTLDAIERGPGADKSPLRINVWRYD